MRSIAITVGAALALLGTPCAQAAEFRATLGGWGYHFDGKVDDRGQRYDFQDDLELNPRRRRSVALEWDTRPGWWPDLAASYSQMGADGDHTESVTFPVPATRTITTAASFDAWEIVARYPFRLGRSGRLSLGVALQQLRGDLIIDDSEDPPPRRERYDELFPQLHAQLRWRLGPLALVATGQGIEHDGSRALDWRGVVELRALEPLLLEFGWQEKRYEISLTDYALDTRLRGALVRVGFLYR